MNGNKKDILTVIAGVIGVLFFTRLLYTHHLAFGDFTPFSGDFTESITRYIFVWSEVGFGGLSNNPFYLYRSVFELLSFGNPIIAQNLFLLTCFSLGFGGFYYLAKKFTKSRTIGVITSLFFVLNPGITTEINNGATGAVLTYFLLPIIILLITRIWEGKKTGFPVLLLALCFACILTNLQICFWIVLGLLPFITYLFVKSDEKINFVKWLFLSAIIGVLFSMPSFYTYVLVSGNAANIDYLNTFRDTYGKVSIHNLFTLAANQGSSQRFLGYFDTNYKNTIAFIIPILAIAGLIVAKFRKLNVIQSALLLNCFLIIVVYGFIMVGISSGYFDGAINNNNLIILSIRNPQKLMYIFAFLYCVLLVFSFSNLSAHFKSKYTLLPAAILVVGLIVPFIVHSSFLLKGSVGLEQTRGEYFVEDKKYEKLHTFFNQHPNENAIYFPFDYHLQLKTSWIENIAALKLGSAMSTSQTNGNFADRIYDTVCDRTAKKEPYLNLVGVRYLVLDKKPTTYRHHQELDCVVEKSYDTPYIWGSYSYFDDAFKSLNTVYEDNDYKIKEVGSGESNYVSTFDNLVVSISRRTGSRNADLAEQLKLKNIAFTDDPKTPIQHRYVIEDISSNIDAFSLGDGGEFSHTGAAGDIYANTQDYKLVDGVATFSNKQKLNTSFVKIPGSSKGIKIDFGRPYPNLMKNGNFGLGFWSEKVLDCSNYDNSPNIKQSIENRDGKKNLRLESKRHNACVYNRAIVANADSVFLGAEYFADDDTSGAISYDLENEKQLSIASNGFKLKAGVNGDSTKYIQKINTNNADQLQIYLYALEPKKKEKSRVDFKDILVKEVPRNIVDVLSLQENRSVETGKPSAIKYLRKNPTNIEIQVKEARKPFYISIDEQYDDGWALVSQNSTTPSSDKKAFENNHFVINGFKNGWFVDTLKYCQSNPANCTRNSNGTFDMSLSAIYRPQRTFLPGLIISGIVLVCSLVYVVYRLIQYLRKHII